MPVEKVSYLFCSWKTREADPLEDLIKLFLPPLVPAATLRTSAIYYVLTRKVHYIARGRGLASHSSPQAAPVLSHLVSLEGFRWREAPLYLPKLKRLVSTASCPHLPNGLLLFLMDNAWEKISGWCCMTTHREGIFIKYLVSRLSWDNAHIHI